MSEQPKYFEEALSNFMHDMASGGAIRHLVDHGYSVAQIMEKLDFPTPRTRVEQTVNQYMRESGILLLELPTEASAMKTHFLKNASRRELQTCLREHIQRNGEAQSYMLCPFGEWMGDHGEKLEGLLGDLTGRERDYIMGIRWENKPMYHRLNSRMLEIGLQLAEKSAYAYRFYFLKSCECVVCKNS